MKTSNSKKRFVLSLVVTVVSIAMLVGATFAWFTDSVTSGKNIIKSGNLSNKWFTPKLDLSVTMININSGHNKELMDRCSLLKEFAEFIRLTREYAKSKEDISTSMKKVIDYCIEQGILSEYLQERRSEVLGSLIREFDQEKYERSIKEASFEEGIERGIERGIEQGIERGIEQGKTLTVKKLLKKFQPEEVAELLEMSIDEVKAVI